MISMQGVPSSLIAKNESWVRKQAQALARHLPSNVERADLIQVGLIAVAQASLGFQWEGDRDTPERWRGTHGTEPSMAELAALCDMSIDEMSKLEQADLEGRAKSNPIDDDGEEQPAEYRAATPHDEVEARVDTGIVMRRLERFFASLPERERQVIDAYLGVGLTPSQLAVELNVTPSRVSQMFKAVVQRTATHFGQDPKRAFDRLPEHSREAFERRVAQREEELAQRADEGAWGHMVESALTRPLVSTKAQSTPADKRLRVDSETRWG
jgi:RNA polymerase sigma factor for flagellar operon FliA